MRPIFLFPHKFRLVGWLLLIPGLFLGSLFMFYQYEIPGFYLQLREESSFLQPKNENFTNELALSMIIIGALFVAFSKEKREDELLLKVRLNAMYWAILFNYAVYFILVLTGLTCRLLIWFGVDAFEQYDEAIGTIINTIFVANLFSPLVIFIVRYHYLIHSKKDTYVINDLYYLPIRSFRLIGILITIPLVCMAIYSFFNFWISDAIAGVALFAPVGLMLLAYSSYKKDDEFITFLRLRSLQIALLFNYTLMLIANFLLYSLVFNQYMYYIAPSVIAIIFIITFAIVNTRFKNASLKGGAFK